MRSGLIRTATCVALALTVLTLLALPGTYRGMGVFKVFALPLSLLPLAGRGWPNWQFVPVAGLLIFAWTLPWSLAACWLVKEFKNRKKQD